MTINLTAEEISDLRSHHERVVACALEQEKAASAMRQAQATLNSFLWTLEHKRAANPESTPGKAERK